MIHWADSIDVYLHREPVDFRKAINGLSLIVLEAMDQSPYSSALFVFCNKQRSQLKVLYWDDTGFALWQKRLEKSRFKWPRKHGDETIKISAEEWNWLLRGLDITKMHAHETLRFDTVM